MNLDYLDGNVKGSIKEYCIGCLSKSYNMYNLIEQVEKRELFTSFFNIELSNYKDYPHFLCDACDTELNIANNFYQNVRKNLITLEEYNKKIQLFDSDEDILKEELYFTGNTGLLNVETEHNTTAVICCDNTEDKTKRKSESKTSRRDNSKIKIIDSNEVERVIEEFKTKFAENRTCIICGFIAVNRRSISSHMAIFHKDIKNIWCLECNKMFENYEEHKENHSSRYQCPFCEKEITVPHYIEHLKSHSGTFECKECNKTFKSAAWLTKHSRIHTNEKPYVCPNCSKGFIQLSSLRYHLGTHGKYSCDVCKKHYRTEKDLEGHDCMKVSVTKEIWVNSEFNSEEGNETEIEPTETIIIKGVDLVGSGDLQNFCKECNKRVKSLKQHINKYHTLTKEQVVTKKMVCEFCQKTFNSNYKLKAHIRTHTGQLPYKCNYCDRRALTRSRLKDHERTHTKEKPYICNVCGKALSQSSVLRTHMRQHTGRPEVCKLCGKSFCRKSQLKLHLSKHMGERPYLCTHCGRTFAQRSHLSEHMVSHSEERPFGCTFCDKHFKTNSLLREHLKLHQGFKPFQCPSCPYACYKAYRLQQHMKQHTKDSDENKRLPESVLDSPNQAPCFDDVVELQTAYENNAL